MYFHSTRNRDLQATGAQALLQGLAPDGGLYVPAAFPQVDFASYRQLSYPEMAARILALYFTDFDPTELLAMTRSAYGRKFEGKDPLCLRKVGDHRAYLELWHGPTLAFKDMALSLLPKLMARAMAAEGRGEQVLVLTATSGDTGKAAMEGFAGQPGMGVLVFYPNQGVSPMQELMMLGQEEGNVTALALNGDFDVCQAGVKRLFQDQDLADQLAAQNIRLSSANSINIGRLIPQIVYYVWAYLTWLETEGKPYGTPLPVIVPTGNFGDVLAAFYAKEMGLPLGTIATASNANRILYDFAQTGTYDPRRDLVKTSSPSMDILRSSNLERFLYLQDPDPARLRGVMAQLADQGAFTFDPTQLYPATFADEATSRAQIARVFQDYGYLIDPHTAVASAGADALFGEDFCLVVSTASPYKFTGAVLDALEGEREEAAQAAGVKAPATGADPLAGPKAELEDLARLSGLPLPQALVRLLQRPLRPREVAKPEEMKAAVLAKGKELCKAYE